MKVVNYPAAFLKNACPNLNILCRPCCFAIKNKKQLNMAKQSIKEVPARRMTVCGKAFAQGYGRRCVYRPNINMSGQWLRDTGFKIGYTIDVVCERGKLTITLSKKQRFTGLK